MSPAAVTERKSGQQVQLTVPFNVYWIASILGAIKLLNHCLHCYYGGKSDYSDSVCPINFPKLTKTLRNKQIMCQRSAVFPHVFLHLHSKQHFRL